ncbi:MAG: hypothetical protein IKI11_11270 [Neisseriaceae bacterium]|nr:hypothetical protein [Neisseriaceae bacterium]
MESSSFIKRQQYKFFKQPERHNFSKMDDFIVRYLKNRFRQPETYFSQKNGRFIKNCPFFLSRNNFQAA